MSKTEEKRTIRLTLAAGDAAMIKDISAETGIPETDILRTGLKLLAAYKKAEKEDKSFVIEDEKDGSRTKLLLL